MSKQYNKILKRRRRKAYIKRKKKLAKLAAQAKAKTEASKEAQPQTTGEANKPAWLAGERSFETNKAVPWNIGTAFYFFENRK